MSTLLVLSAYAAFVVAVTSLIGVALVSGLDGHEAETEQKFYLRIGGCSITYALIAIAIFYLML